MNTLSRALYIIFNCSQKYRWIDRVYIEGTLSLADPMPLAPMHRCSCCGWMFCRYKVHIKGLVWLPCSTVEVEVAEETGEVLLFGSSRHSYDENSVILKSVEMFILESHRLL